MAEFITSVHDPIYEVSKRPVSIDVDTMRKATRTITATSNGSGSSFADSLNGKRTIFNFSNGTTHRMRWDTTCLEVDLWITNAAANGAPISVAPSWNMFGRLIESISLRFNSSTVDIYSRTNGHFLPDFTSRLLRNYTLTQLNSLDTTVFTPIDDYEYIWQRANATKYDVNGETFIPVPHPTGVGVAGVPSTIPQDVQRGRVETAYVQQPVADAVVVYEAAVSSPARFGNKRLTDSLKSATTRYYKYISPDATGSTANQRFLTFRIPFLDLFPRFQGILNNLRSVQIEILWTINRDILESIGTGADGRCSVMGATVVTDDYILSDKQSGDTLAEKMTGAQDNFSYLNPEVFRRVWSGNDIIINTQHNVESVMMFQMGHECVLNANIAPNYATTREFARTSGQFFLFNSEATVEDVAAPAKANYRLSSWGVPDTANGQNYPPSSVQIQYGEILYPNDPIRITKTAPGAGAAFNPAGLYYEYLKGLGKIGDRLNGIPLTLDLFGSTMPFIFLKMFSNAGVKLSDARDLIIKMNGNTQPAREENKAIWIIVYKPVGFSILVDGTVVQKL